MKLLINQLDEHNEPNILATEKYNVDEVIFIVEEISNKLLDNIISHYQNHFKKVDFKTINIKPGDKEALEELINENNSKEIIINLTGGKRINSLILMDLAVKKNIKSIYIDILNKKSYEFLKEININENEKSQLNMNTVINSAGVEIIEESTELCGNKNLIYLSKQIYKNLIFWESKKQKLYDNNIFIHNELSPTNLTINTNYLDTEEKELIEKILMKLEEFKEISFLENEKVKTYTVHFLTNYIKGFLFKSGTWLEIITTDMIKKIEGVSEVKSGVVFLWNNEDTSVRNEIDVLAIKDSIPIFISCKDSEKYNENALNELNVYADKIGGKNTRKILVATKKPIKGNVKTRAEEMGINIVVFNGDENKFIEDIKNKL